MNGFDSAILLYLNRLAGRSWSMDALVYQLGSNYALKTGLLLAFLLGLYFRRDGDARRRARRAMLVYGVTASCAAVVLSRLLALALPFRERPLRAPGLHFVLPLSVGSRSILGWSSFPSDNAALFFGVATTILLVSRRAGILAFIHTFVVR